jgi:hypothetical protein
MENMTIKLISTILTDVIAAPHLYLDPGSGSYIIQLVIAALLGGGFLIKAFWRQIAAFFKRVFSGKKSDATDEQPK